MKNFACQRLVCRKRSHGPTDLVHLGSAVPHVRGEFAEVQVYLKHCVRTHGILPGRAISADHLEATERLKSRQLL